MSFHPHLKLVAFGRLTVPCKNKIAPLLLGVSSRDSIQTQKFHIMVVELLDCDHQPSPRELLLITRVVNIVQVIQVSSSRYETPTFPLLGFVFISFAIHYPIIYCSGECSLIDHL